MNKFERVLMAWNDGILRGAQVKLAKELRVSTATIALWATGKRTPSKGYIALMAKLFHMKENEVLRLFISNTYPETVLHTNTLRETSTESIYNTDTDLPAAPSNSITLPYLAEVPADPDNYNPADVIEWWTMPLRYVRGAKYLVRCADLRTDPAGANDLYLIKPETEFLDGKIMLIKLKQGYAVYRVRKENGKWALYNRDEKKQQTVASNAATPVGLVIRKITEVQ